MPQTDKIGIPVIHGMGDQKPGYSDDLKSEVNNRLRSTSSRFAWQEVYWADNDFTRPVANYLQRLLQALDA
jgi:hypothetical protein